jgi:hypothetical protein
MEVSTGEEMNELQIPILPVSMSCTQIRLPLVSSKLSGNLYVTGRMAASCGVRPDALNLPVCRTFVSIAGLSMIFR